MQESKLRLATGGLRLIIHLSSHRCSLIHSVIWLLIGPPIG